jgi:hypothetical protein
MEVNLIRENDLGNGESSVEFDFLYTPSDFAKATIESHKPGDRKAEESL